MRLSMHMALTFKLLKKQSKQLIRHKTQDDSLFAQDRFVDQQFGQNTFAFKSGLKENAKEIAEIKEARHHIGWVVVLSNE